MMGLGNIGKPATRALNDVGITKLEQLENYTESELLELHGVGPKAIRLLKENMTPHQLSFKQQEGVKREISTLKNELIDRLIARENSLFQYENCVNRDYLESILHDDFLEFGTSGKIYNKQDTIDLLLSVTEDRPIIIHYPQVNILSDNQWLLHYISENKATGNYSNRTSIWKKDKEMKLYFHQGTATNEATPY